MVYVISKTGIPLMPCSNVIARLLLKQSRAKCSIAKTRYDIRDNIVDMFKD